METVVQSQNFQIKVEYDTSKGDPRRVFKSMLSFIDALDSAGAEFVKGIDPDLGQDDLLLGVSALSQGALQKGRTHIILGLVFREDVS